jgi:LDH2 family malate/lactate/ureidoglycolate dehydrogenase
MVAMRSETSTRPSEDGVPSGAALTIVTAAEERVACADALRAAGASRADAIDQANMLVEADLRGHASHGARRLPVLVKRLNAGLMQSAVRAVHEWTAPGALAVDGRRGLGPVVARGALAAAIERAHDQGVVVATIRNSGHLGMLAPYLETMVAAGCAGVALTISEALVHPWGGVRAMVGTNPIGIGIPTGGDPLILDMSTSAVSMGKIIDHAARQEPIPLGWAVDSTGTPTIEATAAVGGAVSPFGGAKGYALGVALEALVALLSGSALGTDVRGTLDTEHPATKGDVFIVFSVTALGLGSHLAAIADYLRLVRASGNEGSVTVPGDRARIVRARREREGIPLPADLWDHIIRMSKGMS